jgi:hypothetical protein
MIIINKDLKIRNKYVVNFVILLIINKYIIKLEKWVIY